MFQKMIKVNTGLEARSVALFVQTASKFSSKIQIQVDNRKVNAKSIMGVISLGIEENQEINVTAEGDDEQDAVDELINFLKA